MIAVEMIEAQARKIMAFCAENGGEPELAEKIRALLKPAKVTVCADCGTDAVEWECWIDANTGVNLGDAAGENWCSECETHGVETSMVEPSEVKPRSEQP